MNCPKCQARAERERGKCNHITCTRCNYEWCWLCNRKFKVDHFDPWNVFGCPNMLHLNTSKCRVVTIALIQLLMVPLILLWYPIRVLLKSLHNPYYFPQSIRCCCPCRSWMDSADARSCCCKLCVCFLVYGFFVPIVFILGLILGVLYMAVLIVPALTYQIYRLLRISCNRCPCFVK